MTPRYPSIGGKSSSAQSPKVERGGDTSPRHIYAPLTEEQIENLRDRDTLTGPEWQTLCDMAVNSLRLGVPDETNIPGDKALRRDDTYGQAPTPRTDALGKMYAHVWAEGDIKELLKHARQLERELAETKAELERLEDFTQCKAPGSEPRPSIATTDGADDIMLQREFDGFAAVVLFKGHSDESKAKAQRLVDALKSAPSHVAAPSPHQPPAVYDPKQGKMVVPGNLPKELVKLFDKTAGALDGLDHPERVKAGLMAVYALGQRRASPSAIEPQWERVKMHDMRAMQAVKPGVTILGCIDNKEQYWIFRVPKLPSATVDGRAKEPK